MGNFSMIWPLLAAAQTAISPIAARAQAELQQAPVASIEHLNALGYRQSHYRGHISQAPAGAPRIALSAAAQLWAGHEATFIDVIPAENAVRDPVSGKWILLEERQTIIGAHWFPEAGRGTLAPDIERWFWHGMQRVTGGHKDKMLILFCLADCWMSWNAAKRLASAGYTNVYWLAEGTDGWRDLDLPLTAATPLPVKTLLSR